MRIRTGFVALVVLAAAMPAAWAAEGDSGLYAGFTLGSHSVRADWYTTETRNPAGTVIAPTSEPTASLKDGAYGLGLVVGYNWEVASNVLLGVEAAAGSAPSYEKVANRIPGLGNTSSNPTSYAAVKTSKPLLVGVIGGYMVAPGTFTYLRANYERIRVGTIATCPADTNVCNPANGTQEFGNSEQLYGWGVGFGVERKFGDMFAVRLEYRRTEYGKTKALTVIPESTSTFGADAIVDLQRANIVELGVLFHF